MDLLHSPEQKKSKQTHITIDVGKRGIEDALLAYAQMKEWSDCLQSAHVHIRKSTGRHESAFIVPSKLTKVLSALSSLDHLVELRVELNEHVALPVEALLRVLKRRQLRALTLQDLALVGDSTQSDMLLALEAALAEQHNLTHMTLEHIRVVNSDGRTMTAPVRALTLKPPQLQVIRVAGTPISPMVTSTRTAMWCYGRSATLTQLHLDDIPVLDGYHVVALARHLSGGERAANIRDLRITSKSPNVANSAGAALAEVVATSPSLTKAALHLHHWDHVGRDMAWALQQRQRCAVRTPVLESLDLGIYVVPQAPEQPTVVELENGQNHGEEQEATTSAVPQEELVTEQAKHLVKALRQNSRLLSLRLQVAVTSSERVQRLVQDLEDLLEKDNETLQRLSLDLSSADGTVVSYNLPLTVKTNLKINRGSIRQLLRHHHHCCEYGVVSSTPSFVDALIREAQRAQKEQDINVLFYVVNNHPELCLPFELQVAHNKYHNKALASLSQLVFWKKHRHAKPCAKTQQEANRHQERMKVPFRTARQQSKKVRSKVLSFLAPKA